MLKTREYILTDIFSYGKRVSCWRGMGNECTANAEEPSDIKANTRIKPALCNELVSTIICLLVKIFTKCAPKI